MIPEHFQSPLLHTLLATICVLIASVGIAASPFPPSPREVREPLGYDAMRAFLDSLPKSDFIKITSIGKSVEGRDIMMVRFNRGKATDPWKVFLLGSQHGDEHAGKDALLYVINEIAANPESFPADVDLTILPMFNPDGTTADTRRNGAKADLNRDHIMHEQPEIKALYRVFQEIMPHVFVDCHEYGRDSESWRAKGWIRWPTIMMGSVNNPYADQPVRAIASKWIQQAHALFENSDLTYEEYHVGGVPPEDEQRYSTTDTNDARNGTGIYGTISFIIESGQLYNVAGGRQQDLGRRVDAYHRLFWFLIRKTDDREEARRIVADARTKPVGDFIPVNYFWANVLNKERTVNVMDIATSSTVAVRTNNFMGDFVVKKNVPRPDSYAIPPSPATAVYTELLKAHAIPYIETTTEKTATVEPARLLSVETEDDPLYARFDGRQIVEYLKQEKRTLPPGTIIVSPLGGQAGRRACILLEPMMLYSVFQYPKFRDLVAEDGIIPVLRVIGE